MEQNKRLKNIDARIKKLEAIKDKIGEIKKSSVYKNLKEMWCR